MKKFRKKPVVISAKQFIRENFDETGGTFTIEAEPDRRIALIIYCEGGYEKFLKIETPEGLMTANLGDWIIVGVRGEIYPCNPEIFEASYEPVQ